MNLAKDKVTIITGAGQGIGRGIAELFSQREAIVIIATIDPEEGVSAEREMKSKGWRADFIQTDIASEQSIKNLIKEVDIKYGKIDVLINNAGVTVFKPLVEATIEDWEEVVNIDLRGVFLCSKYVAKYMIDKAIHGNIINISSNHSIRTLPHTEIYSAAKGGVNSMSRSMAISLGEHGIRVNTICPGFTDTPHYQNWLSTHKDPESVEMEINSMHATGKICFPKDIAYLAYFLAFDESSNITGSEIFIDGGLSARLYTSNNF